MLLSVDHGNYAIKTPFFSFLSGLSEHTSCPPLADELLKYDGRFWALSGKHISYMRDKTQDDRFFILTLVFLYDLKPEEAAEVLHYSIKKFYNGKYEALKKLRTILSEQEDSHER